MGWIDSLNDIVQRYSGQGGGTAPAPEDPHQDYRQVVETAPPHVVANGLSQAFRSDQTPSFPEMLSNLFSHSDPDQRAGVLNRILGSLPPGTLAGLPGLSRQVTAQEASQVTPEQVQEIATHAQRQNPSIVDDVSGFYAQHPQVVKALGGLAITIALQHMMRRS